MSSRHGYGTVNPSNPAPQLYFPPRICMLSSSGGSAEVPLRPVPRLQLADGHHNTSVIAV